MSSPLRGMPSVRADRLLHSSTGLSAARAAPKCCPATGRQVPRRRPRGSARGSKRAAGVERSHVSWRFASWRVAAMPCSRNVARVDRAVDEFPRLPVADAAHRRQLRRQRIPFAQPAQLVDQPGCEHRVEAMRDRVVQRARDRRQQRDGERRAERRVRVAATLQRGQRLAGQSRAPRARAGCVAHRSAAGAPPLPDRRAQVPRAAPASLRAPRVRRVPRARRRPLAAAPTVPRSAP